MHFSCVYPKGIIYLLEKCWKHGINVYIPLCFAALFYVESKQYILEIDDSKQQSYKSKLFLVFFSNKLSILKNYPTPQEIVQIPTKENISCHVPSPTFRQVEEIFVSDGEEQQSRITNKTLNTINIRQIVSLCKG